MMATMATLYSFLTLVLCLLTGGGNDLLDYLPTEAYWAHKQVTISVETMTAQLAPPAGHDVAALIEDLGSADAATRDEAAAKLREVGPAALPQLREATESPDAEIRRRARTLAREVGATVVERGVRRLMAIRTLGELGRPEGVAPLETLLASEELFVAEYARAAIDSIEGKRRPAGAGAGGGAGETREVAASVQDDVWMLPAQCRAVAQLVPRRGSPIGFAELMAAARAEEAAEQEEDAAQVTRMVLALAEQVGNVRVDAATIGLAGNPASPEAGQNPGSVTVVIRGRYNSAWARELARSMLIPVRQVDGVDVFEPDGEQAWLMPSDELFVFVASPDPESMPVDEAVAAVKSGKGGLAADDEMRKLVGTVDTKQVLWGAALVGPEQRALPVAGAFDAVTLVGTREREKTLRLTLTGRGGDAAQVAKAAEVAAKHAKESADFLEGMQVAPIVTLTMELLRTVRVKADDTTATLTAHVETTPAAILSLPMLSDAEPDEEDDEVAHPRLRPGAGKRPKDEGE
jgi:hypothetical protein